MLSVAEALAIVLEHAKPLSAVRAELSALPIGRVLAEAVTSDIDSPPYTKSMMDGYAVRAADCVNPPVVLDVIEEIAAGTMPIKPVKRGETARIMTGGAMPEGADAVVMVERVETISHAEVRIPAAVKPGQHVLERGMEYKAGETILPPWTVLGPQEVGLLAAVGRTSVRISATPRAAVLPTGDEIVEPGTRPGPGQIRNSNGAMLLAQVQRAGGDPSYLGIARDTVESLRSLIQQGIDNHDVLLLSGGVSAGKFDLVPGVLQELGVTSHFHKVMMKPGKPLFFGTVGNKLVFGLPGNPVSSFVCFELFIRPALRRLSGHADPGPLTATLQLAADFRTDNDRPTYWPARVAWREEGEGEGPRVVALRWGGSAFLRDLHTANALLAVPPGAQAFAAGESMKVIVID